MSTDSSCSPLVRVSHAYALNPANIAMVFHGAHGEVEVTLTSGAKAVFNERDLTEEGRALLIPSASMRPIESRNADPVLSGGYP
jgi:hypothetical protein